MTRNLKFFFGTLLVSLPFWWGVNLIQENLEDFLFWSGMAENPGLLMAQVVQENNLAELKPIRNPAVQDFKVGAEAAISVFVGNNGAEKILFAKNAGKTLPIASLTKLMTANIVLEYYGIDEPQVAHLLYPLLIASDNESAETLAGLIFDETTFVDLMNLEAEKLGLQNTFFANSTGLDPDDPEAPINYSTADDLVKFAKYLMKEQPLIWEISTIKAFEDNVNTNDLLEELPGIIGGKTGWTEKAQGCLLLILKSPDQKNRVINVVLGSKNRFEDMRKLIDWLNNAYKW